jgi:hypothetical protein
MWAQRYRVEEEVVSPSALLEGLKNLEFFGHTERSGDTEYAFRVMR